MSDNKRAESAIQRVVAVASGGAATVAATGATATTVGVFWAMFPAAVAMSIWAGFEWRSHRAERWWKRVVQCSEGQTPQEIQGLIEAHAGAPRVRETLLDSVRRLLEAVSDEAVEVLGSLTAEYLRESRPPDPFFRGVARLVADLSDDELADLRELVADLSSIPRPRFTVEQMLVEQTLRLRVFFTATAARDELDAETATADAPAQDQYQDFSSPASYLRLCHLLKVNELARESVTGYIGSRSGPHVMVADRATVARLACHLGVPAAAGAQHRE